MHGLPPLADLSFFRISSSTHLYGQVKDYQHDPRPFYSFGFMLEGEGTFISADREVTVRAGDVIVVPFGCRYYSVWEKADTSRYVSMHFFFQSRAPFGDRRQLHLQKVTPDCKTMYEDVFSEANDCYYDGAAGELKALGCFFRVLGDILPQLQFSECKPVDEERLIKAAAYLEEHCTEKIKVEKLAALCYMSQSHFYTCFREAYGMTPIAYKNKLCVRQAMRLLSQPNVSVEAVWESLGFESASYFRRVFRKFAGCAPAEYCKKRHGI